MKELYTQHIHFFRKLANAVSGSMSSFALAIAGFQVNEAVQNEAFSGHLWKHIQVYML